MPDSVSLLIEPLWNWNLSPVVVFPPKTHTFNRTTMELKLAPPPRWWFARFLLIEPLWNWNRHGPAYGRCRCLLLIEPLWNWNYSCKNVSISLTATFNRTTMELKHLFHRWKNCKAQPFNRTTMELKLRSRPKASSSTAPFNRTTMELKHRPRLMP